MLIGKIDNNIRITRRRSYFLRNASWSIITSHDALIKNRSSSNYCNIIIIIIDCQIPKTAILKREKKEKELPRLKRALDINLVYEKPV